MCIEHGPGASPFPQEIWGQRICALISCYDGSEEDGVAAMRPVRQALPPPLLDGMAIMPFPALQGLFDPLLPSGLQWYWKGDFVKSLPDEAIDAHLEQAAATPSELSLVHLYPIDGAVHRVAGMALVAPLCLRARRGRVRSWAARWSDT